MTLPDFKLIQHALIPVMGSWVDAVYLILLFVAMGLAGLLMLRGFGGTWVRRAVQVAVFVFAVVTFHRCLCMVRGAWQGMQNIGRDDLSAFAALCLALPVAAFTLVFGRVFCGWLCPMGLALDLLHRVASFMTRNVPRRWQILLWTLAAALALVPTVRWLPSTFMITESAAMIWAWIAMLSAGLALMAPSWEPALRRLHSVWALAWVVVIALGIYVTNPWCTMVGGEVDYSSLTGLIVVILSGAFVSMAWCRYACPLGAFLSWLAPLANAKVQPVESVSARTGICPTDAISAQGVRHAECICCGRCMSAGAYEYRLTASLEAAGEPATGTSAKLVSLFVAAISFGAYGLFAWPTADESATEAPTVGLAGEVMPAGAKWYTFGGNATRSGVVDVRLAPEHLHRRWKKRPSERVWRYQRGTGVWSSSAVLARVGGRVLAVAAYYDRNLYAFDVADGRVRWKLTTAGLVNDAPTITVVDGRPVVLCTATDRTLYAISADQGERLWTFQTYPWKDTVGPSVGSSPLVVRVGDKLRVIFSMWFSDSAPGSMLQRAELIAIDPLEHRQPAWRVPLGTVRLSSPALAATRRGPVAIVCSRAGHIWGIDPGTGIGLWRTAAGASIGGTPSVGRCGERVAAFVGDRMGHVYALDAASGKKLWRAKVGHMVDATPTFVQTANGRLLLAACFDRLLYALDADTGRPAWSVPTGDYITATPCVAKLPTGLGAFFWSLDNQIYLADLDGGQVVWKDRTDSFLWTHSTRGDTRFSSPCAGLDANGEPIVVLPAYDGCIYCFSAESTG